MVNIVDADMVVCFVSECEDIPLLKATKELLYLGGVDCGPKVEVAHIYFGAQSIYGDRSTDYADLIISGDDGKYAMELRYINYSDIVNKDNFIEKIFFKK
jgi:hypothetical protein